MTTRRQGSSLCIEFFISLFVGGMAILGGLFIIGFLLVEPIRHPPGSRSPIISTEESGCTPRLQSHHLPHGCTVNDQPQVEQAVCSNRECTCDPDLSAHVCCCRSLKHEPFTNIVCPEGVATPTVTNTTECGCGSCDDLSIQVHVTITNRDTNEAIPAALVLRVEDGPDSVNYLGLTSKHGQLMFTESIGRQYLEIKVLAAGYVPYMTMPMKLHPHKRVLRVGVVMIPSMNMDVGLGGSEIILRLGAIASVSAPAGSFRTMDGEPYEDTVKFEGMYLPSTDPNGLSGVPGSEFTVRNLETGEEEPVGVLFVTRLGFVGSDGEQLTTDQLHMQVSLASDEGSVPDLSLIVYNEREHRWEKHSDFSQPSVSRRKRQGPVILENENTPLVVFAAVASSVQVACWLQGRTFDATMAPAQNNIVSVQHTVVRSGNPLLVRFGTNTGAHSPPLVSNAVCLPVDCGPFSDAVVESSNVFGPTELSQFLAPIPFPDETFDITESAPVAFGSIFSFDTVITATSARPRPFYASQTDCTTRGADSAASASSYFGFIEGALESPQPTTDSCSIKIQILDCFADNSVTITSINRDTGVIVGSTTITVAIPEETTEMTTTSGNFATTEAITTSSGVCDAATATMRAVCLPYVCGTNIQLLVRPNADSGRSTLCEVTGRSMLLSNSLLSDLGNNVQLIVRSGELVTGDFNDPNLGLYYTAGNNMNAVAMTEELCNAGNGGTSSVLDVTTGEAAVFSCF